jgi:hypothetical protein
MKTEIGDSMTIKERIKRHPAVQEVFKDSDGWWVWLHIDWINPELECSQIHEQTITACYRQLRGVRKKLEAHG